MKRYNPKEIEAKWQQGWADSQLYEAVDFDTTRQKYVILTEFPYPSGDGLHLGHVREYTLGDTIARHKRMQGYNVLNPMGYDAFGLPTENYAIKHKIAPQAATDKNVANFQKQFESLGYSIDWSRSFKTSDPDYYRWTQWLFLQFFKSRLAYQKEIAINWCPFCKTGLANEEVVAGRHERCDTVVEKRTLNQWLLKITDYAERLITGLAEVDYPSRIADQQVNWIGRSQGAELTFTVKDSNREIKVFTTRPDTLYGATFLVLAPEHELVGNITSQAQKTTVEAYIQSAQAKSDIERQETSRDKTGVFTGAYAVNPANGAQLPIWLADYVLTGYGTGAIMAVPAHDDRDHEFAIKYELPIIRVVQNSAADDACSHDEGVMINSDKYDGMASADAREAMVTDLTKAGVATERINYRLRDWVFSRQHYWGEPIPIIHCQQHGAVAVPEDQLPVTLPPVEHYEPTDNGQSPLAEISEWVNTICPECGQPAKRETDTMPNWAGSSWYYLRYYDAHNSEAFADRKKLEYWGAVDLYLGGMEHTTLHLLYSRFWHQFLYDQGLVPTPEPYLARRGQGIILATDGSKMSKSKGNVINPTDIIDQGYGADTVRLTLLFLAPYDQTTPWSNEGIAGTFRFLQRVWTLVQGHLNPETSTFNSEQSVELQRAVHAAVKKVSQDIDSLAFNTAISALMELVNDMYKIKTIMPLGSPEWGGALMVLVQLLAPFAPHIAEELWLDLGGEGSVHVSHWPDWDEAKLVSQHMTLVVQVNGKVRAEMTVDSTINQATAQAMALENPRVTDYLAGRPIKKVIFVPGKLVNIVI